MTTKIAFLIYFFKLMIFNIKLFIINKKSHLKTGPLVNYKLNYMGMKIRQKIIRVFTFFWNLSFN